MIGISVLLILDSQITLRRVISDDAWCIYFSSARLDTKDNLVFKFNNDDVSLCVRLSPAAGR
jgi:hypothetical protein